jgi:hypothetical protein
MEGHVTISFSGLVIDTRLEDWVGGDEKTRMPFPDFKLRLSSLELVTLLQDWGRY